MKAKTFFLLIVLLACALASGVYARSRTMGCTTTATATVFNGNGTNPLRLSSLNLPQAGLTWQLQVNCISYPAGTKVTLRFKASAFGGPTGNFGQTLLAGSYLGKMVAVYSGNGLPVTFDVPIAAGSCGMGMAAQALLDPNYVVIAGGVKVIPFDFSAFLPALVNTKFTNAIVAITGI
jgi:hypothetical protein